MNKNQKKPKKLPLTPEQQAVANRQAEAFMQAVAENMAHCQGRWKQITAKHKLPAGSLDELYLDTFIKVEAAIRRNGIKEERYLDYFERSLERSVLYELRKRTNQKNRRTGVIYVDADSIDTPDLTPDQYDVQAEEDEYQRKLRIVEELPEHLRDVLYMQANGKKYAEMQRILQLRQGQIRMRLEEARQQVRKEYASTTKTDTYVMTQEDLEFVEALKAAAEYAKFKADVLATNAAYTEADLKLLWRWLTKEERKRKRD